MVDTLNGLVGRNLNNVHVVDITELLLLGQSGTSHAGLFLELIEEVLESDRSQSLGLTLNLNMLLGLDGLMQTVRITAARHDTAGELIDYEHLIVLDHVILVSEHQVVRAQRKYDIMLDLKVLGIGIVVYLEETLDLLNAGLRKVYDLVFLVNDEVSGLLFLDTHDGIHLGHLLHILAALHLTCQDIACFVELGGLAGLTGYDQRCSRLVYQNRVDLIDDSVVQAAKNELFFVDDHVITQIIEAEFVIGNICYVTIICLAALLGSHLV